MRRARARDSDWQALWKARLKEAQTRAAGGINLTSGEVHHLAIFTALCEPVVGEPCDWDLDVLPSVDALAAAGKSRGRPFRTWKGVTERAIENRDRRLAGMPAPKAVSLVSDNSRRAAGECPTSVVQRLAKEGRI